MTLESLKTAHFWGPHVIKKENNEFTHQQRAKFLQVMLVHSHMQSYHNIFLMLDKLFYRIFLTSKIYKADRMISELDISVLWGHIEFVVGNHFVGNCQCPILIIHVLLLEKHLENHLEIWVKIGDVPEIMIWYNIEKTK